MDENVKQAARLWTLAQPVVSAYVAAIIRDFSARDDVLQDIAVAVMESFERYDSERPFTGWALGIAQHQVQNYLRRHRRDRLVFDEAVLCRLAEAFEGVSENKLRALLHLRECLQGLEDRTRKLCEMRYVQDLKPGQIAQSLGMSANTVAKSLQRARDQLRRCIERRAALSGVGP